MTPHFVNPDSWVNQDTDKEEFALDGRRRIYRATVGPDFLYRDRTGIEWRPHQDTFLHNYGTVPSLAQVIPALQKDRWRIGYPWHDNLCETRKIKRRLKTEVDWTIVDVSRWWSDQFLCFDLGVAERAWMLSRDIVYIGVSVGTLAEFIEFLLKKRGRGRVRP